MAKENASIYATIEDNSIEISIKKAIFVNESSLINQDSIKTTDYTINSYVASRAKEMGGYLGMFTDLEGHVLECAMANVAI